MGEMRKEIFRIDVPKGKLLAMPANARAMFLLLGHAANQMAFYTKLMIMAVNYAPPADSIEAPLAGGQTMMLVRTTIGILHETWLMISRLFLRSADARRYIDGLDDAGQTALDELKKLFGGSGLLARVRNEFAFHHPKNEEIEAGFQLAAGDPKTDKDWHWYWSQSGFNSFYYLNEIVVTHSMLRTIGAEGIQDALRVLIGEAQSANNAMVTLVQALLGSMWLAHFGEEFDAAVAGRIDGAPSLFEHTIPFFFEIPEVVPDQPQASAGVAEL